MYSANLLARDLVVTSGRSYSLYGGCVLETRHVRDSPRRPASPTTVLLPGAVCSSSPMFWYPLP